MTAVDYDGDWVATNNWDNLHDGDYIDDGCPGGGLWDRQLQEGLMTIPPDTYHSWGILRGDKSGSCGNGITVECKVNSAKAPWVQDDGDPDDVDPQRFHADADGDGLTDGEDVEFVQTTVSELPPAAFRGPGQGNRNAIMNGSSNAPRSSRFEVWWIS